MAHYSKSAILSLPMGMQEHDPTNTRTLDVSGSKIHASFAAGAAAPTKLTDRAGYNFNGTSQYLYGDCQGAFNTSRISYCFLFNPAFSANEGVDRRWLDTTDPQRYFMLRSALNAININAGGTAIFSIALATWQDYWIPGGYNTLIFSGLGSGSNYAWLNKRVIGSNATVWAAANPITYNIGRGIGGGNVFSGSIHSVEIQSINLTKTQADDWAIRAMQRVNAI